MHVVIWQVFGSGPRGKSLSIACKAKHAAVYLSLSYHANQCSVHFVVSPVSGDFVVPD